jgi:hypothetical protein
MRLMGEWTWGLYRSVWSASRPGLFTLGERVPDTHCTGGWVGPRTGLDVVPLPGTEPL